MIFFKPLTVLAVFFGRFFVTKVGVMMVFGDLCKINPLLR